VDNRPSSDEEGIVVLISNPGTPILEKVKSHYSEANLNVGNVWNKTSAGSILIRTSSSQNGTEFGAPSRKTYDKELA